MIAIAQTKTIIAGCLTPGQKFRKSGEDKWHTVIWVKFVYPLHYEVYTTAEMVKVGRREKVEVIK